MVLLVTVRGELYVIAVGNVSRWFNWFRFIHVDLSRYHESDLRSNSLIISVDSSESVSHTFGIRRDARLP